MHINMDDISGGGRGYGQPYSAYVSVRYNCIVYVDKLIQFVDFHSVVIWNNLRGKFKTLQEMQALMRESLGEFF
jgi:hypothetical protein